LLALIDGRKEVEVIVDAYRMPSKLITRENPHEES
jgi:hypothetical protein